MACAITVLCARTLNSWHIQVAYASILNNNITDNGNHASNIISNNDSNNNSHDHIMRVRLLEHNCRLRGRPKQLTTPPDRPGTPGTAISHVLQRRGSDPRILANPGLKQGEHMSRQTHLCQTPPLDPSGKASGLGCGLFRTALVARRTARAASGPGG